MGAQLEILARPSPKNNIKQLMAIVAGLKFNKKKKFSREGYIFLMDKIRFQPLRFLNPKKKSMGNVCAHMQMSFRKKK